MYIKPNIEILMKRLTISLLVAAFVLLPLQDAFAHGGGLNSDGCHNVTATGGYHCHRGSDSDDDVNWETIGAIVGGVFVVWMIYELWKPDRHPISLGLTPKLAADHDGNTYAGARWKVS